MVESMVSDYSTGKYTIAEIGKKYGISTGKTYYMLLDAGCKFIRKRRKPMSDEYREHLSKRMKGKIVSDETRKLISEHKSCNYNGLNGYGHTKAHNSGYVLTYVPRHPHAHKDGYVMLHTVLMERHIGRYLEPDEVVHHINHVRNDNRIENLMVMNKYEHMSMHMKERHQKRRNDLLTH